MCVYSSTAVAVAADVLFFFVFFFCIVVFSVPGRIYCFCFSADVCTLYFFLSFYLIFRAHISFQFFPLRCVFV